MRKSLFFVASFLSSFGDALLVCAIPYGLGAEKSDIRFAVIMWLFPSISIFAATLLSPLIKKREDSARTDYSFILISVALIELIFAYLLRDKALSTENVLYLSSLFVILYAFVKEGIPRIFYNISLFKYFFSEDDFTKAVGKKSFLDIVALTFGGFLASYFISTGSWRIAFLLDALTFLILGLTVFFAGKDTIKATEIKDNEFSTTTNTQILRLQNHINPFVLIPMAVGLLFGVSGLIGNYLPLIANEAGIATASTSIIILIFCRLPGMIGGFKLSPIVNKIGADRIMLAIPIFSIATVTSFLVFPNLVTLMLCFAVSGITIGLFNPADLVLRNRLSKDFLVPLNTFATQILSFSQFFGCIVAMLIFTFVQKNLQERLLIFSLLVLLPFGSIVVYFLSNRVFYNLTTAKKQNSATLIPWQPLIVLIIMIFSVFSLGVFIFK